jgi:WD40 repeat protein/serine/threonine protein kinase
MGVVYRARQKSLNRIVALKMIVGGPLASAAAIQRFHAEAQTVANLQHPNIVAIHEVGEHEGQPFFSMDYVQGQNLAGLLREGPLPARRAAGYVKVIAEAVEYAHRRGILHRDLKPSNVLIDPFDQPRITDFGLAKHLESDSSLATDHSSLTLTGQVLGSPNFMAPEQAQGRQREVGPASDVYSMGAMLYHLVTGRPPFQAVTLTEVLQQVLTTEPAAPRLLNPSVPRDLETISLKCLEKEVQRRYPTAQDLAEDLGRFLHDQPIRARPVSVAGKAWKWCRRQPVRAGLIGALALVFVFGLTGVLSQWRRAKAGELIARQNAYAADLKEVQRALEDSDLGRARELLNRHRPQRQSQISNLKSQIEPDLRSWEWRYFWSRCQSDELSTLCQYTNSVSALTFSPDGKWLAVRQGNQTVALWDAVAKRPKAELPAHGRRWCKALAFSLQGNLLAWGSAEAGGKSVVLLRELSSGKEMSPLPHSNPVVSLAFSPDAKTLATLAYDGTASVWDLESQHVVLQFLTAPVDVMPDRLSAAATLTATSAADPAGGGGGRNTEGQQVRTIFTRSSIFTDHYGCVLFSPDGRWLAVGEAKPQIRLVDRTRGTERIITAPLPADGISALAFSPDSRLLAAGCGAGDNDILVWNLAAGTPAVRFAGHSGWIVGLAFSPDGQVLASVSSDQTLRLWDVGRQAERRRFQGNADEIWALAWSPDGQVLVTGARDGSVRYWDPSAKPAAGYAVLPEPIHFWGPAFFPDSKSFLAPTRSEGAVVRWETASLQVLERLSFLETNHTSLDLSKDGRWLVLGDAAGNIQVWDFPARQRVTNLVFPEASIFALWFSPHGNILAAGAYSSDNSIVGKLWAVAGWREIDQHGINFKNGLDAAFSPDERTLAAGYDDGTAAWWDLATRQRQAFFDCQYSSGVHVAFSPDGLLFATSGWNGLMTVWDVATRQARPIGRGYRNALHDVTFSPDSRRLVATGTSPKDLVKLWDVETGRDVATLPGEPGWFCHIGFSPDGSTLFAASMEGIALFWRAPSLAEIEAKEKERRTQ